MAEPLDNRESKSKSLLIVRFAMAMILFATFGPLLTYEFTNYDDPLVVTQNEHVRDGISWQNFVWAWTTGHFANWMPLTWMSHQLDASLFGDWAGGHHFSSLLLHVVGTLFLFEFLRNATGANLLSAMATILWSLHPLHVESVAWIADRKTILAECLGMISLWLYTRHVRKPTPESLGLVLLVYSLSLCAKQTLVTLPLLLLVLDVWPLRRFAGRPWKELIAEKSPFFLLAFLFSTIAFFAQQSGDAVANLTELPWPWRAANACYSAVAYLRRFFIPSDLQVFYPYPFEELTTINISARALVLLAISLLSWRLHKRHPWLAFGWAWFLVALLPTIGFIPIGRHGMADRYADIPMIGLTVALVWTVNSLFARLSFPKWVVGAFAATSVLALASLCANQRSHWKDSRSLFAHALAVNIDNPMAHNQWGVMEWEEGRPAPAFEHFRAAADLDPTLPIAHANVARVLLGWNFLQEGVDRLHEAAEWGMPSCWMRSSRALARAGELDAALVDARLALEALPSDADAVLNLGHILLLRNDFSHAERYLVLAAQLKPRSAESHQLLGTLYVGLGRLLDAANELTLATTLDPRSRISIEEQLRATPENARLRATYGVCLYAWGEPEHASLMLDQAHEDASRQVDTSLQQLIESWRIRIRHQQPILAPTP